MIWPWKNERKPAAPAADTLIVIGVHKEELAFGEHVAERLDHSQFELLHIANGLSAKRPTPEELEQYLANHTSLYKQIGAHIKPYHRLMIDLHCRRKADVDADIFCADRQILDRVQSHCQTRGLVNLRSIQMISDRDAVSIAQDQSPERLYAKPELPECVWRAQDYCYVGLEIYIGQEGSGEQKDWLFTIKLLETIKEATMPE